MYLSLNWLHDHVDLSGLTPDQIAEALTMHTALVEGWVDQREGVNGVVVGEVLTCASHPNADRLTLCTVAHGGDAPAQVVCGAPNVAAGQRILFAPAGTALPNGVKLKKTKIRGEESGGMICAEDELGLGPDHDGIMVLVDGPQVGVAMGTLPNLCDVIFEIDNKTVTHRPDLWGHRGFARELAVLFGRELKPLDVASQLIAGDVGPTIDLEDTEGCPLYGGLCVDDAPQRSPDWMRFRLVACGMRPLFHLVDVSNYVMLELGQPTHPFDRDHLKGDRIVVRAAQKGEMITTLDEEVRVLDAEDLVIADGEQPVALAGIMGSAQAEVTEETRHVFLESAWFDGQRVRGTSSRLKLRTEALARFEKVLDPALAEEALRRYAHLVTSIHPEAQVSETFRLAGSAAAPSVSIPLEIEKVCSRMGVKVSEDQVADSLTSLGFSCSSKGDAKGVLQVSVPSWRASRDVAIAEDLIEEVGRVLGYDMLPDVEVSGQLRAARKDPVSELEDRMRDILSGAESLLEVFNYSTIAEDLLGEVGLPAGSSSPRLANPLQQEASVLRPSVVPGMLGRLEQWLRAEGEVGVFEMGRGYMLGEDGQVEECRQVVVLEAGKEHEDARDAIRDLAGIARHLLTPLERGEVSLAAEAPDAENPWLHPKRSARVLLDGHPVGFLGAVHPQALQGLGISGVTAALLILDTEGVAGKERQTRGYRRVSRFPPARIDLAIIVPYALSTDALVQIIWKSGPKSLAQVDPFDVYRGESMGEGARSIAVHLTFQSDERTLTDEEVNKCRDRIVAAVEKAGGTLR